VLSKFPIIASFNFGFTIAAAHSAPSHCRKPQPLVRIEAFNSGIAVCSFFQVV
jgi:hypothetical protein